MSRYPMVALAGCLMVAAGLAVAAPGIATQDPGHSADQAVEPSAPMKDALALAAAAGGGVGYVGSLLAIDEAATPVEVAIVQRVPIEKMKLGEIVILAKDGCKAVVGCLLARRITELRGTEVATKRYGRPGIAPSKEGIDASLVGRVAYTVDLKTGRIRDMRKDDTKAISFVEALRREAKKWHFVHDTVRRTPIKT